MAAKAFLVLGVLMAALMFISSEVAAGEVAETAKEEQTKDAAMDQYDKGYRCHHGCCGGWYHGRCRRCCSHQSEAADAVAEGAEEVRSDQYGYRCRYGCCGGWYHAGGAGGAALTRMKPQKWRRRPNPTTSPGRQLQ